MYSTISVACCFWLGPGISLVAWQLLKRLTGMSSVWPVCSLTEEFQLDVNDEDQSDAIHPEEDTNVSD